MTGKKRILIADNEIMDITIIKNQLEIIGFELAGTASNGAEAIKKISETNPDIILLDIKLTPEMDGIETATVIKEKSNIPVVFIIANENNNTIKRAKESGSYGFIMRPYDMAILQTTLDNALCLYKSDKTSHKNHKQNRKDSLVELNSALLTLYDKSPVGYLLINKHGVIIAANHKAGDIFGFNKEQLKNKQLSELVLEEYRDNCILILKQIFNYKTEQKWEMKIINCNTFPLHLLAQTAGAVEIDSETLNWIIIQDISEYKHKEYDLKKLSSAVENSPECIVITDIHGTIQYINPKFIELTGYTAEEAIGKNPRVLKSGNTPDIVYKQMWETITKGEIWKGIFQNKSKTGELYWESASIAPIKDENGTITNYIAVKENITDKITNISILKKKEEDIKLILNSTNEGIFGIDLHGKCTFCNKSLLTMLGYPNKDYIEGENIHRLIQPMYPDGSYYNEEDSLLRKASAIGEQIHVERDTFYRADGTCFPVEYWSQPYIQDGKMTGSIVTVINITQRIQTEEFILNEYNIQLALSRIYTPMMKHNISITEIAEIILSVTLFLARSQTGFVTAYDRITVENICYSFAETVDNERVITKEIRKISVIHDRNELQEPHLEYPFDTRKSFFTNEPKILFRLEGEVSTVIRSHAFLSVPVMIGNEIAGQIGISNPHTTYTDTDLESVERIAEFYAIALNRKRDEDELQKKRKILTESINKLTVIMDNTLDLISYIDLDLNILFANRSHKTLLNFEIENMKGKSILEFIHPDDKESAASFLTGIRQNNDFKALRIRVLRNDGEYLTVETSGKPIYDNNIVIGGIISSHDISTNLLYEKSLKDAKKAAEKANKAKSSFLASMSHELRTPLNAIIGFGRLLEMNGKLNRKQIAYVEHIRRSSDHLLDMINDVLDLAKIESGKFVLDKKPFDIKKTITSFYEIIKSISKGKNIKVNFHIENNIGILNADEIRFRQILYNLVSNAIKFTDKGGIISIDARCLGEKLEITICDNGKGIAKEDHEKIFLPFEQLYCEDHSIKGTGLGLSITKHLVELHNGQIRLESDLGKGSKFIITLPERLPMTKDFINSQTETTSDRFAISESYCGRIMVVEDNEVNQELIKEILGLLGLSPLIASTGEEAVEIALHEKFDLIFMDIDLPGIDGIESMKRMRLKRGFSTPIVALTAFKMSGDEEHFISEGMDAVLNKPIDLQKLVSVLKKYLVQKNINNKFQGERTMINSNKYNIDEAAGSLGIPVERFKTIVERFFNEKMDNYLISLESAISGQDFQIIKSEAHKLRGAMANLKFDECADLLKTIESSAEKRDNSTDFTLILDELKKNLENLKNSIFK